MLEEERILSSLVEGKRFLILAWVDDSRGIRENPVGWRFG